MAKLLIDRAESTGSSVSDRRLLALQLRVAQRADELTRMIGKRPGHSFELWRYAENELWSAVTPDDLEVNGVPHLTAGNEPARLP